MRTVAEVELLADNLINFLQVAFPSPNIKNEYQTNVLALCDYIGHTRNWYKGNPAEDEKKVVEFIKKYYDLKNLFARMGFVEAVWNCQRILGFLYWLMDESGEPWGPRRRDELPPIGG